MSFRETSALIAAWFRPAKWKSAVWNGSVPSAHSMKLLGLSGNPGEATRSVTGSKIQAANSPLNTITFGASEFTAETENVGSSLRAGLGGAVDSLEQAMANNARNSGRDGRMLPPPDPRVRGAC